MKHWKLLLAIPAVIALVAMVPQGQDPGQQKPAEPAKVLTMSEMQYVNRKGEKRVVSANNVVEIRLLDDVRDHIRVELYYDNGDYSLIDTTEFHILRTGQIQREVKITRGKVEHMRFPSGI